MCYQNVFRTLKSNEIECRVARSGKQKNGVVWASIFLYKDARVDQRIMDETFGPMNWQASYETIDDKLFCKVSIWDKDKNCWVSKMNVGSESNTEKDKGLASDCLKRACFTWGLGVELYSAPKIYVDLIQGEYKEKDGNIFPTVSLSVKDIAYSEDRRITQLTLVDKNGRQRYFFGGASQFFSRDGKSITIGDATWRKAVENTARGNVCNDGTPIPVWLADYYNIPNDVMKRFTDEVKSLSNGNA